MAHTLHFNLLVSHQIPVGATMWTVTQWHAYQITHSMVVAMFIKKGLPPFPSEGGSQTCFVTVSDHLYIPSNVTSFLRYSSLMLLHKHEL